ncbi:MAG: transposase, partial [Kiritimatiellae bacterium]|nr:transposase [Kiritimatiellia bacterium]
MTQSRYNPEIHHRRSIRLKGHDYAGGGLYFVTICAHRDAGTVFAAEDVKDMVAREWESAVGAGLVSAPPVSTPPVSTPPVSTPPVSAPPVSTPRREEGGHKARREEGGHKARREEGGHKARPYAIMPDHFHALIEMPAGGKSLGDVICAFKSRVVQNYIQGVKAGKWPRFPGKIWHRNYYEMIVRDAEAEKKIAHYIRMNPWRCVMDFGNGLRGMGNPALWNAEKLGVLCSRNTPRPKSVPKADVYLSGFHSTMEKEIFTKLLELKLPVIFCPVWGLDGAMSPGVL